MFRRMARMIASWDVQALEPRRLLAGGGIVPPQTLQVAAGDLDGDGIADLAIIHRDIATRNLVLSTRTVKRDGPIRRDSMDLTPEEFEAMTMGDVNGDGRPDIVIAGRTLPTRAEPRGQGEVMVVLGDGKGGIARDEKGVPLSRTIALPGGMSPTGITATDLDGDGSVDIAVIGQITSPRDPQSGLATGRMAGIDVLWGAPAGAQARTDFAVLLRSGKLDADALFSGDVDGDGSVDLVATQSQGEVGRGGASRPNLVTITGLKDHKGVASAQGNPIYEGKGGGGQNPFYQGRARTIGVGDVDGDGSVELIGLLRKDGAIVSGDFDRKSSRWVRGGVMESTGEVPLHPRALAVGDLDGDGSVDIAACARGNAWSFGISTKQADGSVKLVWSPRSNIL